MNIATALGYAVTCVHGSEGFSAKAYLDHLPNPPIWTIGHGTTRINGLPVKESMICTRHEADLWAMSDMMQAAHFICGCVKVELNDLQAAALISFCYNLGDGNFAHSDVLTALNSGLYRVAADRLLEYDHAGGKVVRGLDTRRARERALFLSGMPGGFTSPASNVELAALATRVATTTADDLNAAEMLRIRPTVTT